jgi:hypothetical protein
MVDDLAVFARTTKGTEKERVKNVGPQEGKMTIILPVTYIMPSSSVSKVTIQRCLFLPLPIQGLSYLPLDREQGRSTANR